VLQEIFPHYSFNVLGGIDEQMLGVEVAVGVFIMCNIRPLVLDLNSPRLHTLVTEKSSIIIKEPDIWSTDPEFQMLRWVGENDLFDGLETLTYQYSFHGQQSVSSAINYLAVVVSVDFVCFILIHILVFKRFVRKLEAENEHTFSIIV